MSRSYKKSPVYTDGNAGTTKEMKRLANKVVRNTDFDKLPMKGKGYKKCFQSWNIHDWRDRYTKQEWANYYNKQINHWWFTDTYEEHMKQWDKMYRRK